MPRLRSVLFLLRPAVVGLVPAACRSTPAERKDYDYSYEVPAAPEPRRPAPRPEPVPRPPAAPQPQAPATLVRLQPGDTLYSLSLRHLGDAKRWQEIARYNGISEAELTRLAVGRVIRIPSR